MLYIKKCQISIWTCQRNAKNENMSVNEKWYKMSERIPESTKYPKYVNKCKKIAKKLHTMSKKYQKY